MASASCQCGARGREWALRGALLRPAAPSPFATGRAGGRMAPLPLQGQGVAGTVAAPGGVSTAGVTVPVGTVFGRRRSVRLAGVGTVLGLRGPGVVRHGSDPAATGPRHRDSVRGAARGRSVGGEATRAPPQRAALRADVPRRAG